ncbi:TIGR01777 family oxidoreductase [Spirulina major CS-329]|uniref:thylakoid membrane protein ThyD n=1 Tax=Spirulina TaxID=1154 RepID=UPI00232DEA59|nr:MULTISPECIES: TIGR01777 family oxidoreductase [Spirulina]MDB9494222.1 TIGR01777 family oxidoreductase [Spirulina subsalsa CS-330]MDB9503048.1 TIGR01777 family oxidoreductase [Spirulina major CS-329]
MKVAITGATGFVGSRLVEKLTADQHQVVVFSRHGEKARRTFPSEAFPTVDIVEYTPKKSGAWQEQIAGCDAVVNLAGAPIAEERWTAARKHEIKTSRIEGTAKIVEAIHQADPKPPVLINASAIGYYGTSEAETFTESSAPGDDFLASICQGWEAAAQQAAAAGVRTVIFRFGIVLGNGGAIAKMIPPFKLFAGGPIGTGKQWFSWIHREDVVNLILKALQDPQMSGVYNATAPNPLRMEDFCRVLGEEMGRPSWLPVPSFVIETLLGDGAIVVLEGQQVLPKAVGDLEFTYQYPTAQTAIQDVLAA